MNHLQKNFKFLREKSGQNQAQLSLSLGFSRGAWNNYETGKSKPSLDDFIKISKHFGFSASDMLETDLLNVEVNPNPLDKKNSKNVELKVERNVELSGQKQHKPQEIVINVLAEDEADYAYSSKVIPITDISVAAGEGHFNNEWIENVDSIKLPIQFLKKDATYLCVKIKGVSMAPTMQDGGYVVIRQLNRSEWANMPDESVFVVADNEGKSYLKRVKNRFKKGFIVLRSDSPDRASFPNFNLSTDDIVSIWYVEWYFTAKMPNVHDQYYTRLQLLEDRVDELTAKPS